MQDSPFTLREMRRSLAGQAVALVALVALFAFIGPFGTYDSLGVSGRIGYWAVAMGGNWLVCGSIMMLTLVTAGGHSMRRRVLVTAAAAPVAAAPGTGVVLAAEALFRPGYSEAIGVPMIYLSVAVLMLVIGLAVVAVMEARRGLVERRVGGPAPKEASESGGGPAPGARFLDRLPEKLGRDLVYLKTADHYVEAFTTAGSTLVLMRFADAVAELDGAGGLRVHRSYWVARRHVTGAARQDGRTTLRLTGGHEVPVSRTYIAAVRAAGLV
ncbi:MAG: LytTR family DNA-binding domain-containing protein [Rhodospirillaceae bacterium]|nr:LytTR family DNA-binding domain-containing protein [Rhodospirillaceae bacterium]